jgi:hypothetical protein
VTEKLDELFGGKIAPAPEYHQELAAIVTSLEAMSATLIACSHEPGDEPFWTIIAKRAPRQGWTNADYVVWDFDYSGISNGHYDLSRERAFLIFNEHVARREA